MNEEFDKIPIVCQICECFLEDDVFIEVYKTKFVCSFDYEIEPKLLGDGCEEFKIGKWNLVEFIKRMFGSDKKMNEKNLGLVVFIKEMEKVLNEKKDEYGDTWIKCETELLQEKLNEQVNSLNLNKKDAKRKILHIANYSYFLFKRIA